MDHIVQTIFQDSAVVEENIFWQSETGTNLSLGAASKSWGIQTMLTAMVSGTKPKPQKETNRLSGLVSYTEWKV